MLDINNKGYTRKYVVGGSGVFTDINNMYNQAKSSDLFRALSGYTRKYVVGGSGLFTPFLSMLNKQVLSNAFNASRNFASRAAATDLGKTAVDAAKSAGKELATSAISTAKEIVINKGKKLIENVNKSSKLTPENKQELKNLINTLDNKLNEAVPDIREIRIFIESSDSFYHPHNSYLEIEGRLVKADGTAYADGDAIALANNGIMHLFERIEYRFFDQPVEIVSFPGIATTMLGLLKYPNDFQQSKALSQMWYKDNIAAADLVNNIGFSARQQYIIKKPTTKGKFEVSIPLSHIFGFCEDYDKVFYGLKHELFLLRQSDNNAIFRAAGVAAGKVDITRISLMMKRATPSLIKENELGNIILNKEILDVGFRSRYCSKTNVPQNTSFEWDLGTKTTEKPRYILVGFQTNRNENQEQNASIFDHCDLRNMWVNVNNEERYPATNYNLSFPNMKISRAYKNASNFAGDYYNMPDLISLCGITPSDYRDLYPIMYFNVSKQSEKMKNNNANIKIQAEFNTPVPAGTLIYALIISDRIGKLTSNGNKFMFEY
ncbi:uncharacterized protein LOC136073798 [Hydra vulgaris]|uniref:uncharacterized protein LOC136073798 n=1 Tax=Hydra vulgaris TaxID=6087 RepID=UPI0032E9DE95